MLMAGTHPDAQNRAPRRFSFASDKHRPPHELKIVVEKQYRGNGITIELHANCFCLGRELARQLRSLRPQHAANNDHARDVAALPVEA